MRHYHEQISDRMFDFKDYYLKIANKLNNNSVIAEVGAADGASCVFLGETLLDMGKTFKFYVIDNLDYGRSDQLQTLMGHIANAGLSKHITIIPTNSLEASCKFPDDHFDFVFIDASHRYELTKADIRLWYRKVKERGFLAGHDYNSGEGLEVMQAVDEVIPRKIERDGNEVEFLHVEGTSKGMGVWWVERLFYVEMNRLGFL